MTPEGQPIATLPLMPTESLRWQPELAPEGPVSAVVSRQSGRIVVYRQGVEIGRARVVFHGAEPVDTHVLLLVEGPAQTAQRYNPKRAREHWIEIEIAGDTDRAGQEPDQALAARVEIPPEFVSKLSEIVAPGATVLVTDELVTPATSGPQIDVINSEPPESAEPVAQ